MSLLQKIICRGSVNWFQTCIVVRHDAGRFFWERWERKGSNIANRLNIER